MASKQWLFSKMLHLETHQIYAENIKTKYMRRCHLKKKLSRTREKIIFVQVSPSRTKQICSTSKSTNFKHFFLMEKKTAKEATISEAQLLQSTAINEIC